MAARPFLPLDILATLTGIHLHAEPQAHSRARELRSELKRRKAIERRERRRRAEKRNIGNMFAFGMNWS